MYIQYVHKLVDLHLKSKNYTEAAFALKLHAQLLSKYMMYITVTLTSQSRAFVCKHCVMSRVFCLHFCYFRLVR